MDGASPARPPSGRTPRVFRCLFIRGRATYLVSMSLGFISPAIFSREKSLFRTLSCTQRSAVARWRILPNPRRRQMPMAAVASVLTLRVHPCPKSLAMACRPREMEEPLQIPVSSASPEERLTVLCVCDQCLITCEPLLLMPPDVDLRVCKQPAKSVSTSVVNSVVMGW